MRHKIEFQVDCTFGVLTGFLWGTHTHIHRDANVCENDSSETDSSMLVVLDVLEISITGTLTCK